MSTTTIQKLSAIRKGSVRVKIGNDFDSLTDIGALRNPVINSLVENQSIGFDNVDPLEKFVKGGRVQVTFDLAEINFSTIAMLDDGIVNLSTVAGTKVAGVDQIVNQGSWAIDKFIKIANQNGDGSKVKVNSVTGSSSGALTLGDDYSVVQVNGEWGIIVSTGTATTQVLTINYEYTPNASKKLTFNSFGGKVLKCLRLENIDENGKILRVDIKDGTNFAPISVDFAGDEEEDVAIQGIDFQGTFVEWVDEQQTA